MKIKLKNCWNKVLFLLFPLSILAQQQYVEIENKFIKVKYNKETCRFRLYTTGGMPEIESDDNKSMLFSTLIGDTETTFTGIKIDGKEYIYGQDFQHKIISGVKKNDIIETALQYNNLVVSQLLHIVKGPTTGNPDTLKIEYKIENIDIHPHIIELKLVLDTFLGNNDGAPFSIPAKGIVMTDTLFTSEQLPEFWYVLDNLTNPSICGIGILKVPGYVSPTKMVLTNWPNLYYSKMWDAELKEGRKFKSSIITGMDSACAVYWGPYKILPGEKFQCCFLYGIYGVAVKTGEIVDLAVATVKKVKQNNSFLLTCDVQNKTSNVIDTLEITLSLPEEIKVVDISKEPVKRIFNKIPPSEIVKLSWKLFAGEKSGDVTKKSKIVITATGKIALPTGDIQQRFVSVEREVLILPFLTLEERNKNIEFLTQQIKQINNQVVEINTRLVKK
ncbi:MAG: hypothetical protein NZ839_02050 [Endomicrobia bacterium]|nr:hypothetical protein [Endomicrobiia bacterium]